MSRWTYWRLRPAPGCARTRVLPPLTTGGPPSCSARLYRLADHLVAIPAVDHADYRRRRQQHESWHLGDDASAEPLKRLVAVDKRKPAALADQLHEALSTLIRSQVTGSEPCLAPCFRPPFSAPGRSTTRADPAIHLANRVRRDKPRSPYSVLLPLLAGHAARLVATCQLAAFSMAPMPFPHVRAVLLAAGQGGGHGQASALPIVADHVRDLETTISPWQAHAA